MVAAVCSALGGCVGAVGTEEPGPAGMTPDVEPRPGSRPPANNVGGGAAGAGGGNATTPPGDTPRPPSQVNAADDGKAGPQPLRRLTRREYDNTVRDLLGTRARPAEQFPSDADESFLFKRAGAVSTLDATMLRAAAESLAGDAVKNLKDLLPCDPAGNESACAQQFVEQFGLRAYRRPLAAAEVQRLTALYATGRSAFKLGFAEAVGLVIETMLQSPHFLYHHQESTGAVAREGGLVRLGSYEVASRLSYFLWGTMPDKELFAAAAGNKLSTATEVEAMARRMLADPKAKEMFEAYYEDWLHLDALKELPKDAKLYPRFNDALKDAMAAETRSFVRDVLGEGDARVASLLTSTNGFVNEALNVVYKLDPAPKGSTLQKANLDPAQRRGLLTQATFLALSGASDGSHPVKRGVEIWERVLCRALPPPPQDVPPARSASTGGTTRERFAEHGRQECGRACHDLFDGLGFAFEHYDGIGAYRTTDNGKPVDATGTAQIDGQTRSFKDAVDLVGHLAASRDVAECMATGWTRFALGRNETADDQGSLKHAVAALDRSQGSLRELMVAIATSRSFRFRSPAPGEVLP
jgi:hypothetical protein